MTTGVEIAGLTLAAFPVLLGGLSSYVSGVQTIKQYRTLDSERTIFRLTLEELFVAADVVESEELHRMINDPSDVLWRAPESDRMLRENLGSSYESCIREIRAIHQAILALEENLRLDIVRPKSKVKAEIVHL